MGIKVLIVDDEPLVRNYIRSLMDWEEELFIICGEACDGLEAIDLISKLEPNIVLFDISMPRMNGVALSKYINEKHKEVKMIALSSYDDYDYVREVLNNGAIDYLLKHKMDTNALMSCLKKAYKEILAGVKDAKESEITLRKIQTISLSAAQSYLRDIFLGVYENSTSIKDYFEYLHLEMNSNTVVMVMQINYFEITTAKYSDKDKQQYIKNIINLFQQGISQGNKVVSSYIDKGRFALLLCFGNIKSQNDVLKYVLEFQCKIENSLMMYMNVSNTFGKSNIYNNFNKMAEQYQTACRNLEVKLSLDYFDIGTKSIVDEENVNIYSLSIGEEKALLSAIEKGDIKEISKIIENTFSFIKSKNDSYFQIQQIAKELFDIAFRVGYKNNISYINYYNESCKKNWNKCKNTQNIKENIQEMYGKLIEDLRENGFYKKHSKQVDEAINYMRSHYMETISLEETAEYVCTNPSYLSRLFGEQIGISFIKYLNKVRVEKSIKLIESGDCSIKEVYSKVGFNNYNYFFKVFKEIMKETPGLYFKKTTIKI